MKKFSTAVVLLLLALSSHAMAKVRCEFLPTAPDSHQVKTGDTLWQIAATFLENPWCWSEVWELNRSQIRDPHWIYPGQTIYFDRERRQLRLLPDDTGAVTRRAPSIRTEALLTTPLPVLAPALGQWLGKTTLIAAEALANAPRVAGFRDGRRMAAAGDTVFVSGALEGQAEFQLIRPLQHIADPETKQTLALTGLRVGTVSLEKAGAETMHQFRVRSSDTEIRTGDRLIPWTKLTPPPWLPHPAAAAVTGRVAAVLRGASWASLNDIVAINRGSQHGLDAGSVIAVIRHVRIAANDSHAISGSITPEEVAALLVFDVADKASLAVVMRASDTFTIGDAIESVDRNAR